MGAQEGFKKVGFLFKFMKVLVLGCGNIGSVAAEDFVKSVNSVEVFVADKNVARAKKVVQRVGTANVSWIQLDTSNHRELTRALGNFDLAMGFLPGSLGYHLLRACVDVGIDLVDVSYMPEDPLTMNDKAVRASVTIVPDCGLAPGVSNILVGHSLIRLDKVQTVRIMVGGLPDTPIPPLGYVITWSPESLIDEYTRKARIVEEGEIVDVEALKGLEEVELPHFGKLEAFYTDGLRTLLHTIRNVETMWEKTLRYPGHAEKVGLLKALGFFDERQIAFKDVRISPRRLTVKLFEEKLWKPEVKDVVTLKIEVSGIKNDRQVRYVYNLLDRFDEKQGITAMARTTAYPASITAQLILRGVIREKGVVPPEKLGMHEELFQVFLDELEKRGVKITEEEIVA